MGTDVRADGLEYTGRTVFESAGSGTAVRAPNAERVWRRCWHRRPHVDLAANRTSTQGNDRRSAHVGVPSWSAAVHTREFGCKDLEGGGLHAGGLGGSNVRAVGGRHYGGEGVGAAITARAGGMGPREVQRIGHLREQHMRARVGIKHLPQVEPSCRLAIHTRYLPARARSTHHAQVHDAAHTCLVNEHSLELRAALRSCCCGTILMVTMAPHITHISVVARIVAAISLG
ncbi:hypothetical protein DFH07DRAFT_776327 [Mycena maculata]|uniref:Uncharacterized protein n=1 Tax=Mycena maculata TaxID=230809 RepID=A0AAD7N503_9AGAR|nr:hypothetical protein DFH07DRAFT_776327 [Mycena maculata]